MKRTFATEQDLARRARLCYIFERSNHMTLWAGKRCYYRLPACWDRPATAAAGEESLPDVWLKLVRVCACHGIDAVDFLRWQMRPNILLDGVPEPNQLPSEPRIRRFLAAFPQECESVRIAFNSQGELARAFLVAERDFGGRSHEDALSATIHTSVIDLWPLFRYCLARSIPGERFQRHADLWEVEAAYQYVGKRRAFDTVWSAWIPELLRLGADGIYSQLIGWKETNTARRGRTHRRKPTSE